MFRDSAMRLRQTTNLQAEIFQGIHLLKARSDKKQLLSFCCYVAKVNVPIRKKKLTVHAEKTLPLFPQNVVCVFCFVFFFQKEKKQQLKFVKLPSFDFILSVSHCRDWLTTAKQSILNKKMV